VPVGLKSGDGILDLTLKTRGYKIAFRLTEYEKIPSRPFSQLNYFDTMCKFSFPCIRSGYGNTMNVKRVIAFKIARFCRSLFVLQSPSGGLVKIDRFSSAADILFVSTDTFSVELKIQRAY